MTVIDEIISDAELLTRAVKNVRIHNRGRRHARWVAVMETFNLGHTQAKALCSRHGLDPEELVAVSPYV